MTIQHILSQLQSLSDPKILKSNKNQGVGDNQYGVKLGEIRKIAKQIKTNPELGMELWETGNYDARMLAILIMKPKDFTLEELDALVKSINNPREADWVNAYIVKKHPECDSLREQWMNDENIWAARAGWNLTSIKIAQKATGIDYPALLARLVKEMPLSAPEVQWTMNFCLVETGINHEAYRAEAINIGENLGLYRDFPVSKGCTSPFAPVWIEEMVKRMK